MKANPTTVLLADDHKLIRHGLRILIEADSSYVVLGEAEDGREALKLVETHRPAILVMDIGMAGLNGIEACRQVTDLYPKVKVIALSAYTDPGHISKMLDAGAAGYVTKDAAADELILALNAVKNGKSYLSPQVTHTVLKLRAEQAEGASTALSERERQVLQMLAEGHTSGEIAAAMNIATGTADVHRRNLMKKLGIHTVAELTKYAIREGITQLE